ncbi:MAG: DUF411 domain-containing protein [Pseudomonadota bacterium]|jgi:hypothetical protein|nr:DUF411 domain-containing protein [Pseudomonadota bacterium]
MSFCRNGLAALALFISTLLLSACGDPQATSSAPERPKPAARETAGGPTRATTLNLRVYKSPTCGCCADWIDHIETAGFHAQTYHPDDLAGLKRELGVPQQYHSCHTAVSEQGYLFEGHVPAKFVRRFLEQPPVDAIGLAVPGMPLGSPGMELGDRFSPYQVLLLKKDGRHEVYATIDARAEQY